jgi:WhiB family redox-sensing transcriptional regulator
MTASATAMPAEAGNYQPSLMTGMTEPAGRSAVTGFAAAGWRAAGACVSADPDLFFPVSGTGKAAAQAARACQVCAGCPVRRQCLQFAVETGEMEGIWGGTTPDERIRARRKAVGARRRARRTGQEVRVA